MGCLLLAILPGFISYQVNAIGMANVVVTSVYWGSNAQTPTNVHPGDVNVQLSIVLSNVGDDVARGVNATLLLESPLIYSYLVEGKEYFSTTVSKIAGDMEAGSSSTLIYTVSIDSQATEGIYRYNLQISYRSAREIRQINKIVTIDVPIWKGELQIQNVQTDPIKIYPGSKQVQVKVFVVNSGKGSISDVHLHMNLESPFTPSSSGSDVFFIGNLAPVGSLPSSGGLSPGPISEADFIIDVDEDASFGRFPIVITQESLSTQIPIGEVSLYVNEKVRFEILDVAPTTFNPGDTGNVIRVEIKNAGSVKADSVRVQLRVGNFFSGTLTDFLGTLLPGESKVAFFTVDIDAKAPPEQYAFDLRVDWTQEENTLDDTLRLILNLEPQETPTTQIAIVLIILIVIIAVVALRRRRKKEPQPSR